MFTGLVSEIGRLLSVTPRRDATLLKIAAPRSAAELSLGGSLAVNGICLTATALGGGRVTLEAVAETRRVTTLGDWRAGHRVHLEPALRAGDPLGGHLVLGHVDGVGRIASAGRRGRNLLLDVDCPPEVGRYLLPKGSIAVDGVSLTLDGDPRPDGFTLSLIPHTLEQTLFAGMRPGDAVNLEADILAKGAAGRKARDAAAASTNVSTKTLTVRDIRSRGFNRRR